MSGKVSIFNVNAEDVTAITVRNFSTSDKIDGWSQEVATRYTPKSLQVERIKLAENKFAFCQGINQVSFSRPTYNGAFSININANIILTDDLILYITSNRAILMRTSGEIIEESDFQPTLPGA